MCTQERIDDSVAGELHSKVVQSFLQAYPQYKDKNVDFETQNGELIRLEIVSGKDYGSAYGRGIIVSGEYVEQYNVFEVLMFAQ